MDNLFLETLKKNIAPISDALDKLARIRGVNFEWKEENGGGRGLGFIAEEIQEILPEAVEQADTEDAVSAVNYSAIIPVAVEAIKELRAQNEALRQIVCLDHPDAEVCQL